MAWQRSIEVRVGARETGRQMAGEISSESLDGTGSREYTLEGGVKRGRGGGGEEEVVANVATTLSPLLLFTPYPPFLYASSCPWDVQLPGRLQLLILTCIASSVLRLLFSPFFSHPSLSLSYVLSSLYSSPHLLSIFI